MRIIAGKHKGRTIELSRQAAVRPTSAFTREALFNIISHGAYAADGESIFLGKTVADLCCGSGAFGLEALSRGAAQVTFLDTDQHALNSARANAARFGELEHAAFIRANIANLPPSKKVHAVLFLDPPYFGQLIVPCLKAIAVGGWADASSLIIVEQDAREAFILPQNYLLEDERKYGRSMLRFLRLKPETQPAA